MPRSIEGPCHALNERLVQANERSPLPGLSSADPLYIFSDYGGEDERKPFKTYSFFLCDIGQSKPALEQAELVASSMLGPRSLEYKKMDEGRLKAIGPFWEAVRKSTGLAITIAVDQSLGPLTRRGDRPQNADVDDDLLAEVEHLSLVTKEHLNRVLHFVGLFLRVATSKDQRVHWITDQDKLFQNAHIQEILRKSGQNLFPQYAPHLNGIDISVDKFCDVPHVRRLMWIPDLLAGAWLERISQPPDATVQRESGLLVTGCAALTLKTQAILRESSVPSATFRSLACSLRDLKTPGLLGHKVEWDSAMRDSPF